MLALACGGPAPKPRAEVTPRPANAVPRAADPAAAVLGAAGVDLPLLAARDGLTADEASAAEPDQAAALPLFDSWGWISESTRSFGSGPVTLQDAVLLLLRPSGAADAFAYLSQAAAAPGLAAGLCPPQISGLDQCVLGRGAGRAVVVGRRGVEVFELTVMGADPVKPAAAQARLLGG